MTKKRSVLGMSKSCTSWKTKARPSRCYFYIQRLFVLFPGSADDLDSRVRDRHRCTRMSLLTGWAESYRKPVISLVPFPLISKARRGRLRLCSGQANHTAISSNYKKYIYSYPEIFIGTHLLLSSQSIYVCDL